MASRTVAQEDYRFGFNGKENDGETYGTGNALDFDARIYDSRLGRWLSTDPLQAKYPNFSPYQSFKNSPILYIDNDGRDNIVYLIVLPSSESKLSKEDYIQIQYKANIMLACMGVSTRVKLFDGTNFDPQYLDATDSYAVVGSKTEISNFVSNPQDNSKPKSTAFEDLHFTIQGDDFLTSRAPEASSVGKPDGTVWTGEKFEGYVRTGIAVSIDGAATYAKDLSLPNEIAFGTAFLIVHGITHNAGANANEPNNGQHLASGSLTDISMNSTGAVVPAYVNGANGIGYRNKDNGSLIHGGEQHSVSDFFFNNKSPSQQKTVAAIKETFGTHTATDNYEKNKKSKGN